MTDRHVDRPYGTDVTPSALQTALRAGEIPVSIYGLGKMGLPLSAVYADRTGSVTGVDVDPAVVESVNDGEAHVQGEPGLASLVEEQVERGRLSATTDGVAAAREGRIHVLIVPTLVDEIDRPDLSAVDSVLTDIASGLAPGDLVVVESTMPPRTTRDHIHPTLVERSGLPADAFGVAVCPERTASGSALRDIRGRYPKVVGGIDVPSTRAATALYEVVTDGPVHPVSDATTAEAVKLFEGIYRDVNIALANEFARTATELDISVREAIERANELPVCDIHDPGPGVGGHCIPNYPRFFTARTETPTPLTATARRINERMPAVTVDRLATELEARGGSLSSATVAVLGVTYRSGVAELRNAPGIDVVESLQASGTTTYAVDPLVEPHEVDVPLVDHTELSALDLDAAIVVTHHDAFETIDWDECAPMVILDGRDDVDIDSDRHRHVVLGGSKTPKRTSRESTPPSP